MISAFKLSSTDPYQVVHRVLTPQLLHIVDELRSLLADATEEMPVAAVAALEEFLEASWPGTQLDGPTDIQTIVPFAVLRSQLEYLLSDAEAEGRSVTELAFEHLRRTLAVDADLQTKWLNAFDTREDHVEKLGAVHLLSHGIWAFKVSAAGAATDLVLGEPLADSKRIRTAARSLVLTEWKLVKNDDEADEKATEARRQIDLYRSGVLRSIELKNTRYIVLVFRDHPVDVADIVQGLHTYRHISLAIAPQSPSVAARR